MKDERVPDAHAPEAGRLWVHFAFGAAYVVLLLRLLPFVLPLDAGGWFTASLKAADDIFAGQFTERYSWFQNDPSVVVSSVVLTLIAYGATHYAVTSRLPEYDGESRMLKLMYFCRSVLYLFVTLLVLLVIVRMFILIYRDLSPPRVGVIRAVGTN